ncbi:MAG: Ig-like domain-containing protein [Lachnospiraceae bacterium]|nr:Ig-like domain-containing protein [Lachnospiraceae bacterium]
MKKRKYLLLLFLVFAVILSAGTAMAAAKAPKKIKLNKKKLTLTVGKSYKLKATVSPKKANKKVKWKSSNKKVVTVTSKGKLKAKKAGKATITCTSKANKKIRATCKVTVKKKAKKAANTKPDTSKTESQDTKTIALKKISLYDKAKGFDLTGGILLDIGFDYTPGVKYDPSNATYKDVKWTSSDTSVFTVDQNGKCIGVGGGTATLTCTSLKDPTIKAECPVEVMKPKNVRDDEDLLAKLPKILSGTCEPLYLKLQGGDPSFKRDSSGRTIWDIYFAANGTIKYVYAYDPGTYNIIGATYCMYSSPVITLNGDTANPSDVRTALREGTYDFASDPDDVIIGWSMWSGDTTKTALQKTLNTTISNDIYDELIKKATSWTTTRAGGSAIIVYGKNSAGELCAKFAGSISYNMASNAAIYNLIGVDPENTDIYGQPFNGSAIY